jgi:predicted metal-dependent enzyme (double-stranded beta helix superfamily)
MKSLTQIPLGPARLRHMVHGIAVRPDRWLAVVRYDARERWYQRLAHCGDYEIWLLSWLPGQGTGFHDHGGSAGAFAVAHGTLAERAAPGGVPAPGAVTLGPGAVRSFGPSYVHDVSNSYGQPAVSVHAYSPPLASMRRFTAGAGGLVLAAEHTVSQW